jgi:hypothetical protein
MPISLLEDLEADPGQLTLAKRTKLTFRMAQRGSATTVRIEYAIPKKWEVFFADATCVAPGGNVALPDGARSRTFIVEQVPVSREHDVVVEVQFVAGNVSAMFAFDVDANVVSDADGSRITTSCSIPR